MKFWSKFGDVRHCVSSVVYWEYVRGCTAKMRRRPNKADFETWVENRGELIPFGKDQVTHATKIYHALSDRWKDDAKRKERLMRVHADIMIAATAVHRGLLVLTEDMEDWGDIAAVIREQSIGPLGAFGVIDPKDILTDAI